VSRTLARNHEQSQRSPARRGAASRHGKPSSAASALRRRVPLVVGVAVAALALLLSAWPAAAHLVARAPDMAWVDRADALGLQLAGSLAVYGKPQPQVVSEGLAVVPRYYNPLRDVSDLVPERIDQGVDFSGSGPVYALGDGVVTNATAYNPGWEGGWITYQLTNGPDAGLMVYVAEDVTPTVQVGEQVTPLTVVGDMFEGDEGIETGWAQPTGVTAESQLPVAGGIAASGPFPTMIGLNFEELLQSLGVPAASNRYQTAYGLLPANYLPDGG